MTDDEPREIDGVIDTAIDRAVHAMMRVDPPMSTRARVLARLEVPAHPFFRLPRLAAAAALAALVVLAVIMTRDPAPEAPAATVAERAAEPQVQQPPAGGSTDRARTAEEPRPPTVRRAARVQIRREDDAEPPAPLTAKVAITPLAPLDPIVVRPLQPSPVEPEDIVIEPLAPIAELKIAPLFPSEGRD
jgi:hypothetical protein